MTQRLVLLAMIDLCAACVSAGAQGPLVRDIREDITYHIMPIAWRDSDNDAHRFGDFDGMTASLDYLETLGVTAVWINPIFPSSAYHGYQHGPADQINPWFGTEAEFLAFVSAAHARGIKVFLDFVVYGISHNTVWYQDARNNPASPYDAWLAFTNASNTTYLGSVYSTWNGSSVGFIHWNLANANANALVTQWARKWLDPNNDGDPSDGIDGYRLDHVWENYPTGPNGWGYNIDDFWLPWKQSLREVNPHVFTFAEQADWGITGVELMLGFDAAMTKPFEFAARDALNGAGASGLYSTMAHIVANTPPGKTFMGIIGDHDVDRLASVLGGSLGRAKLAAAVLLTQPCPPMIYFGDEIAMRGVKGNWGSDANDIPMREPFKWNAVAGPPMSNYYVLNNQAYTNRYAQDNDGRSVEEQLGVPGSVLETYRTFIAARKASRALKYGAYIPVSVSSNFVWAFLRHAPGEQTLLVAHRLSSSALAPTFSLGGLTIPGGSTTVRDIVTGEFLTPLTDANKAAYAISMPGYGTRVLEINAFPTPPASNPINGTDIPAKFGPVNLVATQDNATWFGDNVAELNQLFVRAEPAGLRVGVTGNLPANGTAFALWIDTTPGGQNVLDTSALSPPPGGLQQLTGLRLDASFAPDHLFFINANGGNIYVDQVLLPSVGSGTKVYRGQGTVGDGDGNLSGGVNPNGLQVAIDNRNAAGVTELTASGAETATSGFELRIPYADIGMTFTPGAVFKLAAAIVKNYGEVGNQWLPGVGGGRPNLGMSPDMTAVPGVQFAAWTVPLPGDANCDGAADASDVDAFAAVVIDSAAYSAAYGSCFVVNSDMTGDGVVDARDVAEFVAQLLGR